MKLGKLLKSVNAHQTVVYIVFYLIIPVHALKFKEGIDFLGSPDGGQFFSSPGRVRGSEPTEMEGCRLAEIEVQGRVGGQAPLKYGR